MKIILGLDIDGVLYDWHTSIYTYYQYIMKFNGSYEDFWLRFWKSLTKEKQDYIVSIPIPYETIALPSNVKNFLDFADERSDIYYITSRNLSLETVTRRYLKRYDFPRQDNLIFTHSKADVCAFYGVTHFIDDFVSHANSCSRICKSYLMTKLWNKNEQGNFIRVSNLKEFREDVFSNEQ